jgi:drug/metabolite transporter (DMT)-like permease
MNASFEAGSRRSALVALVAGAGIIGVAPILVRLADAGPAATGMWRLVLSLPLLLVLSGRAGPVGRPSRLAMLAGVAFAFDLGFWHYGIANTSVAKATVLTNLTPVVVTAFGWLFLGQQPARLFLVAVGLAVGGASVMAGARGAGPQAPNPALGDALSLATAIWYALYFLAVSAARRQESATRVMFWASAAGAPLLLVAALTLGERVLPVSPGGWGASIGLGIVHVAGQGLIAWALGRLPAATAAVTVLVQPVVAALLGWMLFGERLSAWQVAGASLALSGVVMAQRASR